jgi:WD40 repeat protein
MYKPSQAFMKSQNGDARWQVVVRAVLWKYCAELVVICGLIPCGCSHEVSTVSNARLVLPESETQKDSLVIAWRSEKQSAPLWRGSFSPNGKHLVLVGMNPTIRVLNASTGVDQLSLRGHERHVASVTFSRDGAHILTASHSDGSIRLWDSTTGGLVQAWPGSEAQYSQDGKQILITENIAPSGLSFTTLYDSKSGERVDSEAQVLESNLVHPPEYRVDQGTFDCDMIVTYNRVDSSFRMWDMKAQTATPIGTPSNSAERFGQAVVSADRSTIATRSGVNLQVWNVSKKKLLSECSIDDVGSISLSPSGDLIVVLFREKSPLKGKARVLDTVHGRVVAVLDGHSDRIASVAWSPSGDSVATIGMDGVAILWRRSTK